MNIATKLLNGSRSGDHAGTDAAARMAHNLVDRTARHLANSEQKVRHTTDEATHKVKNSLHMAANRGRQAGGSALSLLGRHPLVTFGMAMCIGAYATYLVLRRGTGDQSTASTTSQDHAASQDYTGV